MRIIIAFKTLKKHYFTVIPIYVITAFLTALASQLLPLIGTILVLPLSIGVSYTMIHVIRYKRKEPGFPLALGFKATYYPYNVLYLFLRQLLYLAPLIVGLLISGVLTDAFMDIETRREILVMNFIIFAIPSALISLMLAMVPYLLADPDFDQRKHNPLKISAFIMKGNYLKLLVLRLFFVPWVLWLSSGFFLSLVSMYSRIFTGEIPYTNITITWLISLPLTLLVFTPWYLMLHAILYDSVRHKLKDLR